jgi:hypothetical protein
MLASWKEVDRLRPVRTGRAEGGHSTSENTECRKRGGGYRQEWKSGANPGRTSLPCCGALASVRRAGVANLCSWNDYDPPTCLVWQISKVKFVANIESQKNSHQNVHA